MGYGSLVRPLQPLHNNVTVPLRHTTATPVCYAGCHSTSDFPPRSFAMVNSPTGLWPPSPLSHPQIRLWRLTTGRTLPVARAAQGTIHVPRGADTAGAGSPSGSYRPATPPVLVPGTVFSLLMKVPISPTRDWPLLDLRFLPTSDPRFTRSSGDYTSVPSETNRTTQFTRAPIGKSEG